MIEMMKKHLHGKDYIACNSKSCNYIIFTVCEIQNPFLHLFHGSLNLSSLLLLPLRHKVLEVLD